MKQLLKPDLEGAVGGFVLSLHVFAMIFFETGTKQLFKLRK